MRPSQIICGLLPLSLALLAACAGSPAPATSASLAVEVPAGVPSYTVSGAVRLHGQFRMDEDLTLFEAVQRAEPQSEHGDLSKVTLVRDDEGSPLTITVDVASMYETGDSTFNVKVKAGDAIHVPMK